MPDVSDGFDFPLGNLDGVGRRTATEANDGDGFYTAGNFGDYEDPTDSANDYHLGEDWNTEGGSTDDPMRTHYHTLRDQSSLTPSLEYGQHQSNRDAFQRQRKHGQSPRRRTKTAFGSVREEITHGQPAWLQRRFRS